MVGRAETNRTVTIRHVLTMPSGVGNVGEGRAVNSYRGDLAVLALDQGQDAGPGTRPQYNSLASNLLAPLLAAATREDVEADATRTLFEPMQITNRDWFRDDTGHTTLGAGLALNTHGMARLGQMLINGSTWDRRQIVSGTYLEIATAQPVRLPIGGTQTRG